MNEWYDIIADLLRQALLPATKGPLNREQAEHLVLTVAKCYRPGLSIDYAVPGICDELFGVKNV